MGQSGVTAPVAPNFDPATLEPLLTETFGAHENRFTLERIRGGQSCPTYYLDWGKWRVVLRKRPNGPILKGAHAVDREFRVLSALAKTSVPVPKPILYHDTPDTIGTPFYLMERIDGRVFTDTALSEAPPEQRTALWMAAADALAALHKVDPAAIGLGDFGKPGNYFERQIARWNSQYRASPSRPIPEIERTYDWLAANIPPDTGETAICHGDFRIGNLMFHPKEPKVVAILDWELATLGNPLADLGFCCLPWHSTPDEYGGLLGVNLQQIRLPSETAFVERYFASTPDTPPLQLFHKVFALYRFAVIFVGIGDRARDGSAADPRAAALGPLAAKFARRAIEMIDGRAHAV